MNATISEPRSEMAAHAPQVLQTQIAPDQIGLLIGKGGETIRGIQDEYTVQIDVEEDGSVRIYGAGDSAASAREHIDQMMRPMQVGDVLRERQGRQGRPTSAPSSSSARAPTASCTSRASRPGVRIATMEQILERGAVVDVEVVEVDADRGRIALKLVGLHEDGNLLTPQDVGERYKLAFPEGGGPSARPARTATAATAAARAARGGRDRGRASASTCGEHHVTTLPNGVRVASEAMSGLRSAALGVFVGVGSRDEAPPVGGVSHFIEHLLFRGSDAHSALEIAQIFDRFGAELNAATSREFTEIYARVIDSHLSMPRWTSSAAWCGRRPGTTSSRSARSCSRRSRCTTTRPTTSCTT